MNDTQEQQQAPDQPVPTKGRGRLLISDGLAGAMPVLLEKPKAGPVIWNQVEAQELFDALHAFLQLPETYTLIGVFFDIATYQWTLIVESTAIPVVQEGEVLPVLVPRYMKTGDQVRLIDILPHYEQTKG